MGGSRFSYWLPSITPSFELHLQKTLSLYTLLDHHIAGWSFCSGCPPMARTRSVLSDNSFSSTNSLSPAVACTHPPAVLCVLSCPLCPVLLSGHAAAVDAVGWTAAAHGRCTDGLSGSSSRFNASGNLPQQQQQQQGCQSSAQLLAVEDVSQLPLAVGYMSLAGLVGCAAALCGCTHVGVSVAVAARL